jgi:hypothetical protein
MPEFDERKLMGVKAVILLSIMVVFSAYMKRLKWGARPAPAPLLALLPCVPCGSNLLLAPGRAPSALPRCLRLGARVEIAICCSAAGGRLSSPGGWSWTLSTRLLAASACAGGRGWGRRVGGVSTTVGALRVCVVVVVGGGNGLCVPMRSPVGALGIGTSS